MRVIHVAEQKRREAALDREASKFPTIYEEDEGEGEPEEYYDEDYPEPEYPPDSAPDGRTGRELVFQRDCALV